MYYAIVPSSNGYELIASEEPEAMVSRMREGAFVYKNPSHLSEFCDKQTLTSVLRFFNVPNAKALHELVCMSAKRSEEVSMPNNARAVKPLKIGKPIDGRTGTKRYMCLEVIQRSKDSHQAIEEMVGTLGMSRGRAIELLRYAISEGYVTVGE